LDFVYTASNILHEIAGKMAGLLPTMYPSVAQYFPGSRTLRTLDATLKKYIALPIRLF
jgi:hypothetical protein